MISNFDDQMRWKRPLGHSNRMERLKQRQQAIFAIRQDLYTHGFVEIETPLLIKGTCPDLYIDSIQADGGYLATSTEYQIKRLIVGGFDKVFTLTKNFRANDRGRFHSIEFTMLEWARAHETLHMIEEDVRRFTCKAFSSLYPKAKKLIFGENEIDILADWKRLSVREAFEEYLNLTELEDFSLKPLIAALKRTNLTIPENFMHSKYLLISYLFDLLQKKLGLQVPTFLYDWPAYLTTSAPINPKDPALAERSELYIAGLEIADGFPFLTNAKKQKALFQEELQKRQEHGKPLVTLDEKFLEALSQGLPEGAGMALGIDRLIMILTNSTQLSDVQAFDWDEL